VGKLNLAGLQAILVQKYYFPRKLIMLIINSREEIPLGTSSFKVGEVPRKTSHPNLFAAPELAWCSWFS
jgi:hypothetical protein